MQGVPLGVFRALHHAARSGDISSVGSMAPWESQGAFTEYLPSSRCNGSRVRLRVKSQVGNWFKEMGLIFLSQTRSLEVESRALQGFMISRVPALSMPSLWL